MAQESAGGGTTDPRTTTTVDDGSGNRVDRSALRTAAWGGLIGTALEQYDFVIYGTATAIVFNEIFFPDAEPAVAILAGFGAYAVGFLARPLGGLFFSRYGDRLGRKFVLVATLFLMGISTFLIGLLPDYRTVGVLAPALLVVLRLLQGFGAGAEQAGGVVLLTEIAPRHSRGRYASLVFVGASAGTALGAVVWILVQLLPEDQLLSWGWRLVFFSSAFVTVAAYVLRRKLRDAPVFEQAKREQAAEQRAAGSPIRSVFTTGRRAFLRTFALNIGGNTQSYVFQVFIGSYLIENVGVDPRLVPQALLVGALFGCAAAFTAGLLTDRFGRRPVIIAVAVFLVLFPAPAFLLLDTGDTALVVLVIVLGFVFAAYGTVGSQAAAFAELSGSRHRYAGVALGREFSAVLGGGIAPLLSGVLVQVFAGWLGVALYMMAIMMVSLLTAVRMPETRGRDLLVEADA
ncbi:MFS transporter [Pseudonocardia humida]|uniref:MHS family MFS transporter n=1 Tax=Pseudonocardia humida TaxID=2800819 RepID=A0ABT1A9F3_9PSEU|nr:MFS transporter [Pseudonocardia humida]MCO1659299.1 MHS family MFS transporter [Pseudonocardia humida]